MSITSEWKTSLLVEDGDRTTSGVRVDVVGLDKVTPSWMK